VEEVFAAAMVRFPSASNYVRNNQRTYQENRDVEPPAKKIVAV
jgi:hypothetical protein